MAVQRSNVSGPFDEKLSQYVAKQFKIDDEFSLQQAKRWTAFLSESQRLGAYSYGNRVKIFDDGDEAFGEIVGSVNKASKRVWMDLYMFDDSKLAEEVKDSLCAAAKRGCDVVLIVDWVGSFSFPKEWLDGLLSHGVHVIFFNPVVPLSAAVGPIFYRDHRKIIIADEWAFCGSMNISQDAVGKRFGGHNRFYDIHLLVEGPAVADLADVVLDTLQESCSGLKRSRISPPDPFENGVYLQVLQSNVRKNRRSIQFILERALNEASGRVRITTSYFLPPGFIRRALQFSSKRNVVSTYLMSGNSDVPGDVKATTHVIKKFFNARQNTKAFFMTDRHCHAKYLTVDDIFATVGSYNIDRYSSRRNLEVVISIFHSDIVRHLAKLHDNKLSDAATVREMTMSDWAARNDFTKLVDLVMYHVVRMLGKNVTDGLSSSGHKNSLRRAIICSYLNEELAMNIATGMMWGLQ